MNNEVEIEELDRTAREARRFGELRMRTACVLIYSDNTGMDNEMKYDNLARSLAMVSYKTKIQSVSKLFALIETEKV